MGSVRYASVDTAHAPSGENASVAPAPSRIAGEPSVLRRYDEYPAPPPSPDSVIRILWPSGEMSVTSE